MSTMKFSRKLNLLMDLSPEVTSILVHNNLDSAKIAEMLGENVKHLRKKQGWSQSELAERVGVHLTHLNRIENGKYVPQLETVVALANVLQVSVDHLISGADNSPAELRIEDQTFAERINLLNSLSDEERKAVVTFIDALLSKKKMVNLLRELVDAKAS